MSAPECKIRTALGTDLNFIYSHWLNSYRVDSRIGKSVKKSVFFASYYAILDRILQRADTLVACLSNDEFVILGFLVHEDFTLHYAFVKDGFRRFGIARKLYNEAFGVFEGDGADTLIQCTHRTFSGDEATKSHPEIVYNPFLLFSPLASEK